MTGLLEEVARLQRQSQDANYDAGFLSGRLGVSVGSNLYVIPDTERNAKFLTVTLNDGTQIKADCSSFPKTNGTPVKIRKEQGVYVAVRFDGNATVNQTNTGSNGVVAAHEHNIGGAFYFPVDPAGINDGQVIPIGTSLSVRLGRVTYTKTDGTVGIYDGGDIVDLTSHRPSSIMQQRWVVHYIDGSGNPQEFAGDLVTGMLNTTTHIADAINDCLDNDSEAFPYHVTRMRGGMVNFGAYKAANVSNLSAKDSLRIWWHRTGPQRIFELQDVSAFLLSMGEALLWDADNSLWVNLPIVPTSDDSVSNPPTKAELTSAFGDPSVLYDGYRGLLDSGGAATDVWLCFVKNSEWWYTPMTKAV